MQAHTLPKASMTVTDSPPATLNDEDTGKQADGSPTPKRRAVKRKAGSGNLGQCVKRYENRNNNPAHTRHTSSESTRRQHPTSTHPPPYPTINSNNIHSFAWDLKPRFGPSTHYPINSQGSYHTSTLGSATLVNQSTNGLRIPGHWDSSMTAGRDPFETVSNHEQSPFDLQPLSPRRFRFPSPRSDASTPSISSFPLPPRSRKPQYAQALPAKIEQGKSTIYHLRGASFEIINPRQSLYDKKIETPLADREESRKDYFGTPIRRSAMATKPSLCEHSPSFVPQETVARSTPPRSLFDDLQSAYSSITTRSAPKSGTPEQNVTPTRPSATRSPTQAGYASNDAQPLTATPTRSPKTPHATSVRNRISDILRLGRQDQHSWRRSRTTPALLPGTSSGLRLRSNTEGGAASLVNVPWSFEQRGPDVQHAPALGARRAKAQQDDEGDDSIFGFSSERQLSVPQLPTILSSQPQHSSRSTNHSQDDSTDEIIASYGDCGHTESPLSHNDVDPRRRRSMPLLSRGSNDAIEGTTSTIGHILDQYRRMDDSRVDFSPKRSPFLGRTTSLPAAAVLKGEAAKRIDAGSDDVNLAGQTEHIENSPVQDATLLPHGDIRGATARALNVASRAGPNQPLPDSPSRRFSTTPVRSSQQSSTLSGASYGDTRNLLQLSSTPDEIGRGITSSRPIVDDKEGPDEPSDDEDTISMTTEELDALPTIRGPHLDVEQHDHRRSSSRSMHEVVEKDLRYFSHISGISQLSGSIFLYDGDERAAEISSSKLNDFKFTFANGKPAEPATLKKQLLKRASAAGVAAFTPQTVEQGIKRLPMGQRDRLDAAESDTSSDCNGQRIMSGADSAHDSEDDIDWQTVSESRRTLPSRSHLTDGESLADISSIQSFSAFSNAGPRSGDSRNKSLSFTRPTSSNRKLGLTPTFAFKTGSSSMAPLTQPLYNQYKHPSPLPDSHDNPFISSPPQLTGPIANDDAASFSSAYPKASPSAQAAHHQPWVHHDRGLSVIHEQTEHGLTSELRAGQSTRSNIIHSSSSSVALSDSDSFELGSEPGPSISLEAEDGSPIKVKPRPLSNRLSSGADPALLQRLREDDPRMASSPLSQANSFSKLSRLGPKANVTGSPNGTGMREVGSSVVDSSSPYVPNSSPRTARTSASATSRTPATALGWSRAKSPLATNDPISPLAGYDRQRYSRDDARGPSPELRSPQSTDGLLSPITQAKVKAPKRSITGQTRLMQMRLLSNDALNDATVTNFRPSHDTTATLESRGHLLPYSHSHPRLRHRYRSPSSHASGLKQRKRKISWWVFAICALFPYLLILYGHSGLDVIINWLTHGDIQHFGQTQKKVARIAGWTIAGVTVATLIIAFVVIRTVPNDFPR